MADLGESGGQTACGITAAILAACLHLSAACAAADVLPPASSSGVAQVDGAAPAGQLSPGVGRGRGGKHGEGGGKEPSAKEEKEDRERQGLPPEIRDISSGLDKVDRSDGSVPWEPLGAFKRQYNLFNPTPRVLRREFITDRPDKTINPVTVDAGHFQLEMDLAIATFDRRLPRNDPAALVPSGAGGFAGAFPTKEVPRDDYKFLFFNLRAGLTNSTELQVFARPFQFDRQLGGAGQPAVDAFGVGDMRALLKTNLWGNEGGSSALCVVTFMDIPVGGANLSTRALEGGASAALLFRYPRKTYLGLELGADWRHDQASGGYHLEVPASVSLARSFTDDLSAKAELAAVLTTERNTSWFGVLALAVLYDLGNDLQADVGINIGLTSNATDWQPYVGVAKRF